MVENRSVFGRTSVAATMIFQFHFPFVICHLSLLQQPVDAMTN